MQQIIPFGALPTRLFIAEKHFDSDNAWKLLKERNMKVRMSVQTFALGARSLTPARVLRSNQVADEPEPGSLASARDKPTSPATDSNTPEIQKSTSLGLKRVLRRNSTQRELDIKECRQRSARLSIGIFFITLGMFISVLLLVQLHRQYCKQGGWQKDCLLWATPLISFSTCPCTMLEAKCGADVQRGWVCLI